MNSSNDSKRELLRHALATLAYRGEKAVRNAPAHFSSFHAGAEVRRPGEILAHIGDLMDWGLSLSDGSRKWHDSEPQPWDESVDRFFAALKRFDDYLASSEPLHSPEERLLQGPIADALTHVGQIAILRRLAGEPIRAENYFQAEITAGRVGVNQAKAKREF